ncbi:MAG: hypothetical protein PS018_26465 [bacterium]|nr:hypothetical protein [bacterium]
MEHTTAAGTSREELPLDEDDIEAAISDSFDVDWTARDGAKAVMRLLADAARKGAEAALARRGQEPVAWRHEIVEPDGTVNSLLSNSSDNPFSHWLEKHRDECTYTVTPLYAHPAPPRDMEAAVEAGGKAVVAEWQTMIGEMRPHMGASETARAFVSPGNYRLVRAALLAAAPLMPVAEGIDTRKPNICDCELGHNGMGIMGRECDCPAGNPTVHSVSDVDIVEAIASLELAVEWLEIDMVAEERGVVDRIQSARDRLDQIAARLGQTQEGDRTGYVTVDPSEGEQKEPR